MNNNLILVDPPNLVYGAQNLQIQIQARVTAGGGGIYLFWPTLAWNGTSIDAGG